MNAREYREHREFSRMRLIETTFLLASVGAILIAGAVSYIVAIESLFGRVIAALPH